MGKITLTFLDQPVQTKGLSPAESILHELGQEISSYAKGYFYYMVTTLSVNQELKEASLIIIVPEIGYDYKILTIENKDVKTVITYYYTLKTKQTEVDEINIENGWTPVFARLVQLLGTPLSNSTFRFLIDQIIMKREREVT
jgi:hypothetical protein